jgi:CheY-like chemotaxis protein
MLPPLNKIMLVEDEPDIQAVAVLALESIGGFTVETCNSGKEAIERAGGFAPDLILLDIMMPGMDGLVTLNSLREIPEIAKIPVIFMTAKVQSHEIDYYKKQGAIGVIPKPFDPMTLSETIKDVWENYWR